MVLLRANVPHLMSKEYQQSKLKKVRKEKPIKRDRWNYRKLSRSS